MNDCVALVLSGGSGSRFGTDIPKQYQMLGDEMILRRTVRTFLDHPEIDAVRVVLRDQDRDLYQSGLGDLDLLDPVEGGPTRQDSTRLGLESLSGMAPGRVLIHDGARPFPSAELISGVIAALENFTGAIPAIAVSDTIKKSHDSSADTPLISETIDRTGLWRAQTPQGFRYPEILAAHQGVAGEELTDDAMIAERAGHSVALVPGNEDNIKITTPGDMARAQRIAGMASMSTRIGSGFDVHSFGPGDHIILGGVRIDHDHGLVGHSDADALLHAVTDAILGAIADGDIGTHFPPSDPQWADADSAAFLNHAIELMQKADGRLVNIDATVICESPKIGPHRDAIRNRMAEIMDVPASRISIKATTTERLGFTGRGEGLAAQAVVSVAMPGE